MIAAAIFARIIFAEASTVKQDAAARHTAEQPLRRAAPSNARGWSRIPT
jgi:hypothetical protein